MAYIEAKGIYKTFGRGDAAVHALRGISLSVDKDESSYYGKKRFREVHSAQHFGRLNGNG